MRIAPSSGPMLSCTMSWRNFHAEKCKRAILIYLFIYSNYSVRVTFIDLYSSFIQAQEK